MRPESAAHTPCSLREVAVGGSVLTGDEAAILDETLRADSAGYGSVRYTAFPLRFPRTKRRALRRYGFDLPQRLVRAVGSLEEFSADQVREVIAEWGMNSDYEPWAYALMLEESAFLESEGARSGLVSYGTMRREILCVLELGDAASLEDVIQASYRLNNPAAARVLGELSGGAIAFAGVAILALLYGLYVLWNAV